MSYGFSEKPRQLRAFTFEYEKNVVFNPLHRQFLYGELGTPDHFKTNSGY